MSDRFNWVSYLPRPSRRVVAVAGVISVMIVAIAFTCGYGEALLAALGAALVRAVATESVKAILRGRPRNA